MFIVPILLSTMSDTDDRALIAQLYTDHRELMYKISMRYLGNHHDAEDAINTTIIALIRNVSTIQNIPEGERVKYIARATSNTARNIIAKRGRDQARQTTDEALKYVSAREGTDDHIMQESELELLLAALRKLPPTELLALQMKYIDDATDEYIGNHLGIKPVSVRSMLSRARNHARSLLSKEGSN